MDSVQKTHFILSIFVSTCTVTNKDSSILHFRACFLLLFRCRLRTALQTRFLLWTSDCWTPNLPRRLFLSWGFPYLQHTQTTVSAWKFSKKKNWHRNQRVLVADTTETPVFRVTLHRVEGFINNTVTVLHSCPFPYYCPANSSVLKSCEGGSMPVNTSGLRGSKNSCCRVCEGGTYRPHLSAVLQCIQCPSGFFCPPGSLVIVSNIEI